MPRGRSRICLQDGLKLDLNRLIRWGFARPGEYTGPLLIQWSNKDTGKVRASGLISAELRGKWPSEGGLRPQERKRARVVHELRSRRRELGKKRVVDDVFKENS
jgi:hypothetical protein